MSNVGTKNELGVEAIRSKNLGARRAVGPLHMTKNLRVISSDRVHQDEFILLAIEVTWLRPPKIVHLIHKRALSDDGAHEVHRENAIVRVSEEHPLRPLNCLSEYAHTLRALRTCGACQCRHPSRRHEL